MLKVLRRIVQEVAAAENIADALQLVVKRVRDAMETEACSIFMFDRRQNEFVLMATKGLKTEGVGIIRVPVGEGIIGLIGEREEPINLEDAPSHPNFFLNKDVGEDRYRAFLGVPIIHQRRLLGVMFVQQEECRRFDESEEAFLVTMSAQLAPMLASAQASGFISVLSQTAQHDSQLDEISFGGIPSVSGVGIGSAVIVYPLADLDAVPERNVEEDEISKEIELFNEALKSARHDIHELSERMEGILNADEKALFDVYLRVLAKESLGAEVIKEIRKGHWAQGALKRVIKSHVKQFEAMEDEYLRERAVDFRDLGRRVLSHLQASQREKPEYPEQTILVGDEVTAAALAEVPEGQLAGIVSGQGSSNSHVAILARALGVPTVMGVEGMVVNQIDSHEVIVDGYYGQVYVSPSDELRKEFLHLIEEEQELDANLEELRGLPAETPDGHRFGLYVNAGLAVDAGLSLSVGAEGIGLYRTEVPFLVRENFPTEEEQRIIYRQLLQAFSLRPVVMRTLDVGGDKALPYFPIEEDNPFLGWRGIRITLDHPEVFLVQVRAMLRASIGLENLRIMLPMISSIIEVEEAFRLLSQAHTELLEEGLDVRMPPVGIMAEVPSVIYLIREFTRRVDFVSVGSNDLTQYLLAVDRNNSRVAGLYDALHPAVLRALIEIVDGVHAEEKEVSICGEMAGDPVSVLMLMAMGFDSLSMSSTSLPRIKWVIRNFPLARAKELLDEVLQMDNPTTIRFHLEQALEEAELGGLIRAGK